MRSVGLIARSVLTEAVRRREIYVIVFISVLLIGTVMSLDFFQLEGLTKFYREVALKVMSFATALTVIVLAARQLPREFETRTIYPLLAKPVSRVAFLFGKLLGVMLAAGFCFALFMIIYIAGALYLGGRIPWGLFAQYIFLQMLMMLILATLSFWLSMLAHLDAAITIGVIFYAASAVLTTTISVLYDYVGLAGKVVLVVLNFVIPQLSLFDLSGKAVHSEAWGPVGLAPMSVLTVYGLFFATLYFSLALFTFRRRPL